MNPRATNTRLPQRLLAACLALALVAAMTDAASACPMCKAALASQDQAQGDIIGGFFWSILFMLAMPFTLLGSFSAYMYYLVRRARAEQAAKGSAPPAVAPSTSSAAAREPVEV